MKKMKFTAAALSMLLVLGSCGTSQKTGTAAGAGIGALIGKLTGNTGKGALIGAAAGAVAGTTAGTLIGRKMDKAAKAAAAVANAQVETTKDANGLEAVKVTFDSGILFQTGKADLSATAKTSLQQFSQVLKNNTACDVAIQGYTDNTGWKNSTAAQSAEKNKALSLDRATSVSSYLQALGVSAAQIKSVEGLGEANPVADNSTAAGKEQNRRVEVYMYASQEMIKAAENGTLN